MAVGDVRECDSLRKVETYEYGEGQLAEVGGMGEGPEDDDMSYPQATDQVETTETGQLSKGGVEHGGINVLGHLGGMSFVAHVMNGVHTNKVR